MTGLSARALADAARADKLPNHKIHGRRYMSEAQIEEYIAQHIPASVKPEAQLSEDESWEKFLLNRKRKKARDDRKGDTRKSE